MSEIFYCSSCLIKGIYLPSEKDLSTGALMTEEGLFPTTLSEDICRFFQNKNAKPKDKGKTLKKPHFFYCWVYGTLEEPYYRMHVKKRMGVRAYKSYGVAKKSYKLFPRKHTFITRGIIVGRDSEKVVVRVQQNPRPNRTAEDIENSINYIQIKDCPGKVRSSQFWSFHSVMKDGFLHYKSGELIAKASIAKKYLT